jgi:hypothetical protein
MLAWRLANPSLGALGTRGVLLQEGAPSLDTFSGSLIVFFEGVGIVASGLNDHLSRSGYLSVFADFTTFKAQFNFFMLLAGFRQVDFTSVGLIGGLPLGFSLAGSLFLGGAAAGGSDLPSLDQLSAPDVSLGEGVFTAALAQPYYWGTGDSSAFSTTPLAFSGASFLGCEPFVFKQQALTWLPELDELGRFEQASAFAGLSSFDHDKGFFAPELPSLSAFFLKLEVLQD